MRWKVDSILLPLSEKADSIIEESTLHHQLESQSQALSKITGKLIKLFKVCCLLVGAIWTLQIQQFYLKAQEAIHH